MHNWWEKGLNAIFRLHIASNSVCKFPEVKFLDGVNVMHMCENLEELLLNVASFTFYFHILILPENYLQLIQFVSFQMSSSSVLCLILGMLPSFSVPKTWRIVANVALFRFCFHTIILHERYLQLFSLQVSKCWVSSVNLIVWNLRSFNVGAKNLKNYFSKLWY